MMKTDEPNGNRSRIDLKQHQRFKRVVPWALIRKVVMATVLGGLIYYLTSQLPQKQQDTPSGIEVEID